MRERKRILDQWLSRLEAGSGLIESAILEINRRLAMPGEVEEWNAADYTSTDQMEFNSEESIEWVREPAHSAQ